MPQNNSKLNTIKYKQNLYSTLILAIFGLAFYFAVPTIKHQPCGLVYTYTDNNYSNKNSQELKVYSYLPYNSKAIGKINAEFYSTNSENRKQLLLEYGREQAAKLGADGVIITGYASRDNIGVMELEIIRE